MLDCADLQSSDLWDMLLAQVTLLKIVWRLESRQSFRLTKMLTRNNEIDRCAIGLVGQLTASSIQI